MTRRNFSSRKTTLFTLLFVLWQLSAWSAVAQAQQNGDSDIETIMVTGRRPGPPLWMVSKDDHVLYIFGYLSPLPKGMRWESGRVEEVLNKAQEFIGMPVFGWNYSLPRDLARNPDGGKLEDVLPPEYWELYLAFTEENFRRNRGIEKLRPAFAANALTNSLYNRHDLASGDKVSKTIDKLARRNQGLKLSDPNIAWPEGLKARLTAAGVTSYENLSMEQELACFESGIKRVMRDINLIKQAANSWAEADVRELGYLQDRRQMEPGQLPSVVDRQNACSFSMFDDDAALQAELKAMYENQIAYWLTAVESALVNNKTTFALLGMNMLLNEEPLLDKLRERGYEVQVPN
jgi:hypothetical protein